MIRCGCFAYFFRCIFNLGTGRGEFPRPVYVIFHLSLDIAWLWAIWKERFTILIRIELFNLDDLVSRSCSCLVFEYVNTCFYLKLEEVAGNIYTISCVGCIDLSNET